MKTNYDALMRENAEKVGEKNKLLLHACCAPCASGCVDRLTPYFDVTFFFYNPNVDGEEEYDKRAKELERFVSMYLPQSKVIVAPYRPEEFFEAARGLEREPERGARCTECFRLRLARTAAYADENGFDYFATTLTLSPLKNAELINTIGQQTEKIAKYLCSDFKKHGGNLRSGELCHKFDLYRQNYCGCVFSKNKRE